MKAVVQDRYGTADVLRLDDVATPTPEATSVLLMVRSASANALGWRILSGRPWIGRPLGFGPSRPKRRIRGVDVAGEVVAVPGPDPRCKVGDAMFGLGSGTFAEFVAADESEITSKDGRTSYDDAATLGIAAFTALQGLRDRGQLGAGQSVTITGAGSGVGTFAVRLARWMGARVTAVTGTENVELLRSIGADVVLDDLREDLTRRPDRFDVVFDLSGLSRVGRPRRTLRPGGTLVIVGGRGGFGRFLNASPRRRLPRQRVHGVIAKPRADDLAQLGELAAEGRIRPIIDRVYPLEGVPQAMTRAGLHRARGKLVIHVSGGAARVGPSPRAR